VVDLIHLCIFGTRTFYNNPEASKIIDDVLIKLNPELIITSDADGVCKLAIDKAKEHSIPVEIHFLNKAKYAAGQYEHRSLECLKSCNYVLFIHDGESKGTLNEIDQAKKFNLKYEYYKIKNQTDFKKLSYNQKRILHHDLVKQTK